MSADRRPVLVVAIALADTLRRACPAVDHYCRVIEQARVVSTLGVGQVDGFRVVVSPALPARGR